MRLCQAFIEELNRLTVLLESLHGLRQLGFELADDTHLRLNFVLSHSQVSLSLLLFLLNGFSILFSLLHLFLKLLDLLLFVFFLPLQLLFVLLFLVKLFLLLTKLLFQALLILTQQ